MHLILRIYYSIKDEFMKKNESLLLVLLLCSLLLFTGCAQANDPLEPDQSTGLTLEHFYETTGYVYDLRVTEDRVYVAEDQAGFSIYNHKTDELVVDYYDASYENMRLVQPIEKDSLLVVFVPYGGLNGIRVFDISDMNNILNVATISGNTTDLFEMHAIRHSDGYEIIWSLDNGDNKIMLGGRLAFDESVNSWLWTGGEAEYDFNFEIGKFDVVGDTLYVCSDQLGITIMQRGQYEPVILGRFDTKGLPQAVKVVDDFVYVADRQNGIVIADATVKTNPVVINEFLTTGNSQELDVEGNILAVASGSGGVFAYDISDPMNPVALGRIDDSVIGYTYNVEIQNGVIFASTRLGVAKISIDSL